MKHQIKNSLAAAFFFLCLTTRINALGAGAQIGGIPGLLINQNETKLENISINLTGTFRMERFPLTVGSGLEFGKIFSSAGYGFSLFADYRAVDVQLKNLRNLYSGFGTSAKLLTKDFDCWTLAAGIRFFAGIEWLFYDGFFEVYAQQNVVPTYIKNLCVSDSEPGFMLCLPFETGLRMHF